MNWIILLLLFGCGCGGNRSIGGCGGDRWEGAGRNGGCGCNERQDRDNDCGCGGRSDRDDDCGCGGRSDCDDNGGRGGRSGREENGYGCNEDNGRIPQPWQDYPPVGNRRDNSDDDCGCN